ncbi:MAG: collagen-like protein [Spirulina sp.]
MKRAFALALPTILIGGAVALSLPSLSGCSMIAWANETRLFGRHGEAGQEGRPGQDGQPGTAANVIADGNPANFMLSGTAGEQGEDGDAGYRPRCESQPRDVAHDLQAAHGGDGGSGGRGGDGGSGGNLTVYYRDLAQLQRLSVTSVGGPGGRGGRGGRGTLGCRCRVYRWERQTCTGTPGQSDYRCQTHRYRCRDGRDGAQGRPGPDGRAGEDGQLWLVNQLDPLQPENPSQSAQLTTFAAQPLALSRNLWETRSGANALLAIGSQVRDSYQVYTGRVAGTVRLNWQAARPISLFAAENVTAEIQPDGTLAATFSDDLWADYRTQTEGTGMTLTINRAARRQDVTRLAWGGTQGQGPNLRAVVLDLGGESAFVETQFRVTLRTTTDNLGDSRRPRYTTAYEGILPSEVVSLTNNRFELALGQLPIDARSLRPGTYAQLEITALRSLGNSAAEQVLSWQGPI